MRPTAAIADPRTRLDRAFLAITCLDSKTAWIAGKEGIVFGTKDGGDTWTALPTGSTRHIFAIEFPNSERGHAVGDFGTMVHTEDGGKTWRKVDPIQGVPETYGRRQASSPGTGSR